MRLNGPKNLLLLAGVFLLPLETSALAAQADNEFNASSTTPVTLNFNTTGNWQQGGPGSWDPNDVGNINFLMAPVTGTGSDVTVNNINDTFGGISSLTTSEGTSNSSLTLVGTGGFLMDDASGLVHITPSVTLNLEIDIEVACDLLIDTSSLVNPATQSVNISDTLILTQENANLTVSGTGTVRFTTGSTLEMNNGTLQVGADDQDAARLDIEEGVTFGGGIDLAVGGLSRVFIDDNSLTFNSISGAGTIQNTSSFSEVDLIINGGTTSNFTGSILLTNSGSSLTVTGSGTTLILGAGGTDGSTLTTNQIGQTRVTDGGTVLITPMKINGQEFDTIATLNTSLFIDGGTFGGEGIVELRQNFPNPNFQISSGWIQGGNNEGSGTLTFSGIAFGGDVPISFNDDAGLQVYFDPTQQNVDSEGNLNPYIEFADVTAGVLFNPGANVRINLIAQGDYLNLNATAEEWFQSGWQSLEGELLLLSTPFEGSLVDLTGGDWDGAAGAYDPSSMAWNSLPTRVVSVFTNSDNPGFTELYARITADYAANAGQYQVLGNLLNELIPGATANPFGTDAQLLTGIDYDTFRLGGSIPAYYKSLQQNLTPQSALVSNRVTANNMYFDVSRRNLREVAIGTRGPGMLKAQSFEQPTLLASQQEADAISANSGSSAPRVIIQGTPNRKKEVSSDVFQALFVDGYGRWDRMNEEGNVEGYTATTTGVATGWGIGLSEGITVGLTAGWENTSADVSDNLGNTKVNSFRGTPFISWSGIDGGNEQYAILTMGGGYNTADGLQKSTLSAVGVTENATFNINGWEFDVEGAVGARIPLSESVAIQPEASLRYSLLNYTGTIQPTGKASTNYNGGDTSFINGRIGAAAEWLISPTLRLSGSLGYQGQAIEFGTAQYTLPAQLGRANLDFGSGQINQLYTGIQLLWAPSWNTSFSVSYDGAYGDGDQNAISGGLTLRF